MGQRGHHQFQVGLKLFAKKTSFWKLSGGLGVVEGKFLKGAK